MRSSSNWSENYEARIEVATPGDLPGITLFALSMPLVLITGVRFGPGFVFVLLSLAWWLRYRSRPPAKLPTVSQIRIQLDGAIDAADWPSARVGPRSLLLPDTLLLQVLVGTGGVTWLIGCRSKCATSGWRRLRVLWALRHALN